MTTSLYDGMLIQTICVSCADVKATSYRVTTCYCCGAGCGTHPPRTMWAIKVDAPPLCSTCRGEGIEY